VTRPPGDKPPVDEEYVQRQRATGFATMRQALRAAAEHEEATRRQRQSAAKPADNASLIEREKVASSSGNPGDNLET
jgi:hypothetical protein